ncbi:THO complex subunit 2 [[Candida] zeylanoides]
MADTMDTTPPEAAPAAPPAASGIYTFLADDVVADFDAAGTQRLLEACDAAADGAAAAADGAAAGARQDTLSLLFTELVLVYEEARLSAAQVAAFLAQCVRDSLAAEVFCQVVDVVAWTPRTEALVAVVHPAVITTSTLARTVSPELLSRLGAAVTRPLGIAKRDEYYTQKKYNLLHEAAEGYAKVVVELHAARAAAQKQSGAPAEAAAPGGGAAATVESAAATASSRLVSLSGHYALDPNRVLDLILEVLGAAPLDAPIEPLAVCLLRPSQWWPPRPASCAALSGLSAGGSATVSKLIGLRLLRGSPAPPFWRLVAVLLKIGAVNFASVYQYAAGAGGRAALAELEAALDADLQNEVVRASASALALAAPLLEEDAPADAPAARSEGEPAQEAYVPALELLRAVLAQGLYHPAVFILTQHPFLAQARDVPALMNKVVAAAVAPMVAAEAPLELHGAPPVESMAQLAQFAEEFVKFCPENLAQDAELYAGLCEVVAKAIAAAPAAAAQQIGAAAAAHQVNGAAAEGAAAAASATAADAAAATAATLLRNYLLPPLPLLDAPAFHRALLPLPLPTRYTLYGELYNVLAKTRPRLKIAHGRAAKQTKDVLKRLSKENVRPMMRRLAKISAATPLPCFLTVLQQIESYDNLNALVVETARYFSPYAWDNMALAVMMRLTQAGRANVQANGINDRQWVQSLASFVGQLAARYPRALNLPVLVDFLVKSLVAGDTSALVVLRELLGAMGGVQSTTNLTLRQIDMINCGGVCQRVVYRTIGDERFERAESSAALAAVLQPRLTELFVLLCRVRPGGDHLKVVASREDDVREVLHMVVEVAAPAAAPAAAPTPAPATAGRESDAGKDADIGDADEAAGRESADAAAATAAAADVAAADASAAAAAVALPPLPLLSTYDVPPPWSFELWRGRVGLTAPPDFNPSPLPSPLYAAFWRLSLHDINYTPDLYAAELDKLRAGLGSLRDSIAFNSRNKDAPRGLVERLQRELAQNERFIAQLPHDEAAHAKHHRHVRHTLSQQTAQWLTGDEREPAAFLQFCLLPRATHSSFDAAFAAQFLQTMQALAVPHWRLERVLDDLFGRHILFGTLFTSTPSEAENLGLFYAAVLGAVDAAGVARTTTLGYHQRLLADLRQSLGTSEYMSRRNAITFLKNLLGVYPVVEDHCEALLKLVTHISTHDERGDLQLSSSAMIGHIESRRKHWVHMWDFAELAPDVKAEQMQKRQRIKQRAAQARQRAERQKALERAQEATEAAQRAAAAAREKALSYDEGASRPRGADAARVGRASEARGRYDQYSKYGGEPTASPGPPKKDLKSRLKEAKMEYKAKAGEAPRSPAESKTASPPEGPEATRSANATGLADGKSSAAPRSTEAPSSAPDAPRSTPDAVSPPHPSDAPRSAPAPRDPKSSTEAPRSAPAPRGPKSSTEAPRSAPAPRDIKSSTEAPRSAPDTPRSAADARPSQPTSDAKPPRPADSVAPARPSTARPARSASPKPPASGLPKPTPRPHGPAAHAPRNPPRAPPASRSVSRAPSGSAPSGSSTPSASPAPQGPRARPSEARRPLPPQEDTARARIYQPGPRNPPNRRSDYRDDYRGQGGWQQAPIPPPPPRQVPPPPPPPPPPRDRPDRPYDRRDARDHKRPRPYDSNGKFDKRQKY